MKLNDHNNDKAGCGGLIRDSLGRWVHGFARNLGCCSIVGNNLGPATNQG